MDIFSLFDAHSLSVTEYFEFNFSRMFLNLCNTNRDMEGDIMIQCWSNWVAFQCWRIGPPLFTSIIKPPSRMYWVFTLSFIGYFLIAYFSHIRVGLVQKINQENSNINILYAMGWSILRANWRECREGSRNGLIGYPWSKPLNVQFDVSYSLRLSSSSMLTNSPAGHLF